MLCSVNGCSLPSHAKGWCQKHYTRWWRHGDPAHLSGWSRMPVEERFVRSYVLTEVGCWEWTRTVSPEGYARLTIHNQPGQYAHRWAYEHFVGPIPEGFHVHHKCKNRRCVNPDHLETTAPLDHLQHHGPERRRAECRKGHPLSGNNLYVDPKGRRVCRECDRERGRRYQARKSA